MEHLYRKIVSLFLFLALFLTGCETEDLLLGNIVGRVSDAQSGAPLSGALVTITPGGYSIATGDDGCYEFRNLEPKQYKIQVSKEGYELNNKTVLVLTGKDISGDVQLTPVKQSGNLSVSVSTLNFGIKNTSLSFDIRNNGNAAFDWNISGIEKVDWLEFNPTGGEVEPRRSHAVQVELLRHRLTESKEVTILINADKESVALKITAEAETKATKIALNTNTLDFGTAYTSLTFDVENIGNAGDVKWTISGLDVDWLSIDPMSGTTSMAKSSVVKADIDRSKMEVGKHTTTLLVNADGESLRVTVHAEKLSEEESGGDDPSDNPSDDPSGGSSGGGVVGGDAEIISCSENLVMTLQSCKLSGSTATVELTVKNEGQTTANLMLSGGSYGAYIYDDHGVKYAGTNIKVAIANSGYSNYDESTQIPPSVFTKLYIRIENVYELSSLFTYMVIPTNQESDLILKNIPIEGRSAVALESPQTTGELQTCNDNLLFTLLDCKYGTNYTTVSFRVLNEGDELVNLQLSGGSYGAYAYDDMGNKYSGTGLQVAIANSGYTNYDVNTKLPSDIFTNGYVRFSNFDKDATEIVYMELPTNQGNKLVFKNVKIRK